TNVMLIMASSDELGGTLDVDVVGLVDLDFKSEPDFFDFDSGGEFGLFGEAGVALHTTATTTTSNQSCTTTSHGSTVIVSGGINTQQTSASPESKRNVTACKRKSHWNALEKDLFQKGLELFGPNWSRISNFIATKSSGQVRSFHKKWSESTNIVHEAKAVGETCVHVPVEQVCITTDFEDPLGLIETATTTITTTPLSPKRNVNVEVVDFQAVGSMENESKGFNSSGEIFVPCIGEEWVIESDGLISLKFETSKQNQK
ncbi:hypothetical protein OTU49_008528, partial [Cherax quadricarinatus]